MDRGLSSLFRVSIPFDQSQLFFPTVISWLLGILLVVIAIVYGRTYIRQLAAGEKSLNPFHGDFDKLRFFGTIVLTIIYFVSMDYVGSFFPNMGYGFLLMSIPFMFLLSLLYVHDLNRKKLLAIALSSLISPCVAWYVLADLFNITLP